MGYSRTRRLGPAALPLLSAASLSNRSEAGTRTIVVYRLSRESAEPQTFFVEPTSDEEIQVALLVGQVLDMDSPEAAPALIAMLACSSWLGPRPHAVSSLYEHVRNICFDPRKLSDRDLDSVLRLTELLPASVFAASACIAEARLEAQRRGLVASKLAS